MRRLYSGGADMSGCQSGMFVVAVSAELAYTMIGGLIYDKTRGALSRI